MEINDTDTGLSLFDLKYCHHIFLGPKAFIMTHIKGINTQSCTFYRIKASDLPKEHYSPLMSRYLASGRRSRRECQDFEYLRWSIIETGAIWIIEQRIGCPRWHYGRSNQGPLTMMVPRVRKGRKHSMDFSWAASGLLPESIAATPLYHRAWFNSAPGAASGLGNKQPLSKLILKVMF